MFTSQSFSGPTVACIGSRQISDEERRLIVRTAMWLARHGIRGRSGGASGADDAWEEGYAVVDPSLFVVCAPDQRRRRAGVQVQRPPYPDWVIERAVAEWEFQDRLVEVGLPPYADPELRERFEKRSRWCWLEQQEAKRRMSSGKDGLSISVAPNTAYVQLLMIRNAAIVSPAPDHPVDLVLGVLNPDKPGGGGTGHAFRLARALGVPTFDLRNIRDRKLAREALHALVDRSVCADQKESLDRSSPPSSSKRYSGR